MNTELIKFIDNIFYLLTYISEYTHDNFKMRYKPKSLGNNFYCIHEEGDVMYCTHLSSNNYRIRNIMVFYKYDNVFRMTLHDFRIKTFSSICTEYTNMFSEDSKFNPCPKGEGKFREEDKLPTFSELEEDEYFQNMTIYDLPSFDEYQNIHELFWYLKENIEFRKEFYSFDTFIRNDIFSLVQTQAFTNFDLKNNKIMMDLLEESFDDFKREYIK